VKSTLAVAIVLALGINAVPAVAMAQAAVPVIPVASAADQQLLAIADAEYAWRHADAPGQVRDRSRLGDVSEAAQQARLAGWQQVLGQLDRLDQGQLSAEGKVNYAVYRAQILDLIDAVNQRTYQMPFNADSSFWSSLGFMAQRRLADVQQAQDYIAVLEDVPRHFDQQITNMRAGLARGFSVPRAVLDGREVSIAMVAELKDPAASPLYAPLSKLPASIPAAEQARLQARARAAIGEQVVPAFGKLLTFFNNEYVPQARTTLAAEAMPDGEAFYRSQIREYTTLDLSPAQIHEIGLAEVARIRAEMDAVIDQTGFTGSSDKTRFADFLQFLRTDAQFYATTPQQLLSHAAWIAKRIDANIGRYFTLPRARFALVPVPDDIAPFWTAGRGGNNTYWLNTYNLPARPMYNLPALTLHEADPGHAMQGALAAEQAAQPAWRRDNYISAYGEGWGLYTEKLGVEMGVYETPYEDFGRLTYEMWRACRLVIDTGVHHYGWSREQALAYLRDNTALSEHEVTTEVDRYISWPAQALSYKLGEIEIWKLRRQAESELGSKFDLKAFHDFVLQQGSVPLPVLRSQVEGWISARRLQG
jgi:uncharacterized protein (DUF885 family)